MVKETTGYDWINSQPQLAALIEQLASVKRIALDTEFIGEGVYMPRLCLIQITADNLVVPALVDPLANLDWKGLAKIFADEKIEKVLHSPRQDLEIVHQVFGVVLKPVFDTQLAAAFLGYGDQPALARMLLDELGVVHEKGERYTDWAVRPLSNGQLVYAAQDVADLLRLRDQLAEKLKAAKRYDWFLEESVTANRSEVFIRNDDDAWQRVGDKRGLRRKELIVLRSLAAMRERLARNANRPREYIIADRIIVQLARSQPQNEADLSRMRGWKGANAATIEAILEAIQDGRSRNDLVISDDNGTAPTLETMALADLLAAWVKVISQRKLIAGSLLAVRSEIDAFARWGAETPTKPMPPVRFTKGWRWEFLGKDLASLATGKKTIGLSSDSEHVLSIK